MKRKIDDKLTKWKNSSSRKPLVVQGARQVGKTYSILEFGKREFYQVLHLDFSAQKNACVLFEGDITPQQLLPQLEALTKVAIGPDTLIFFDEIQACPRALTSLKYFCERAPQYCVVAAGSLLGVALGREEYSYPVGKVDTMSLYPLDFEEFLIAQNEELLIALIRSSYQSNESLNLHEYALQLYRRYLLVGGMPEVVQAFLQDPSQDELKRIQGNITQAYLADMTKYATAFDSAKILNVWRSVPEQLAKENHKFQYSTIASSARAHQYEAAINWLHSAGLLSFCYRVSEGSKPLRAYAQHDFFKLYLLDTGLLAGIQGLDFQDILAANNKGSYIRGGVAENYVMQQLVANEQDVYYWGTSSKAEVDFAVQLAGVGVVPLEVKSGANVTARSMEAFRKAYDPPFAIRVSAKNFGFENGIKSVPLYAAFCIGG